VAGRLPRFELDKLPVLPAVVIRLMDLSPTHEAYFEQVLDISGEDPALALRVIQAANSSASAPRSPIVSLQAAVARLGAARIGEIATAMSLVKLFTPDCPETADMWIHAVEVAATTRVIATASRLVSDADGAYLCGLLHDVGRLVLLSHGGCLPDRGEPAWCAAGGLAEEREIFGIDHAELGARVCEHWHVPARLVRVVRGHHRPAPVSGGTFAGDGALLAAVEMADRLSELRRTGGLDGTEDRFALAALIAGHCVDAAWPEPPLAPGRLVDLLPEVEASVRLATEHLGLAAV